MVRTNPPAVQVKQHEETKKVRPNEDQVKISDDETKFSDAH
jgi:hypothetical protein